MGQCFTQTGRTRLAADRCLTLVLGIDIDTHYEHHLRGALAPLLSFAWRLLAILFVSRLVLVVWQWQRVVDADMLGSVFLQGLRFDLLLVGLFLLIPVLCIPLLASNRLLHPVWRLFLRIYLPIVLLIALFMELSTPSFIEQFDFRPNILFIEYLDHPREVFATLWAAYKTPLIVAAVLVSGFSWLTFKQFRQFTASESHLGVWRVAIVTPLLLILCVGMVRSTLDHRPVNPSTVALSNDPLVNDLALSSTYTVLYAIYESLEESKGGFRYSSMDDATAIAEVRAAMTVVPQSFLSDELPTLHHQANSGARNARKNLVIIVEESLGAEFVGSLGGLDLTPNLDSFASEGIWFENMYATGTRSARGLEAIVSGFTPTPARSVVKLPKSQRSFFTLASLLGNAGYESCFIYGGEAQFDNMRRFFMNNGFDWVIDEGDYDNPVFTGSWGVSDEDLFDRTHTELLASQDKLTFTLVFTSSNHSPFEFPDGRIELHDEEKGTVNNAVKYADYAVGRYIRMARDSAYWDNTVFLIVADHNSRVYGADIIPIDRFHIPAVILGGSISPATFKPVASQIDLGPTLLSLIGVAGDHPMTGHDLTQPEAQTAVGRAAMQFSSTQAYMQGDQVLVMQKDMAPRQFTFSDGHLIDEITPDEALSRRAAGGSVWSSVAYQKSLYRLP